MRVLVLSNVWVEPTSSAAGRRMLQILQIFRDQQWQVTYATTANSSEYAYNLSALGISTQSIAINDAGFDAFAKAYAPHIILFDRFMVEEQFGWRVAQECPDALRILDTEDLHCLRKARQQAIKENRPFSEEDLVSDVAKREIASIYRCDVTLMISKYEIRLLQRFFKVPASLCMYLPFLEVPLSGPFIPFAERQHFVSIGNFLHAPNWDATLQLKTKIWPRIKKELPEAQIHVYGAYPSEKVLQLHNEKEGFLVKGRAINAKEVIAASRVLLAPLRFGAGLKGKFIDTMQCGSPSVTTAIGVEGMQGDLPWCGAVSDDYNDLVKAAVQLYRDEKLWEEAQKNGVQIINERFQKSAFDTLLLTFIKSTLKDLKKHRLANFTGQILQHHSMQSTKYMSKWIEEKNK